MTKPYKDYRKGVGQLIRAADKGVLASQYQLFEMYSQGKYVEQSDELASKYFDLLQDGLAGKNLFVKSLDLYNFRRFKKLSLKFERNITVIIGDNGSGKHA